MTTNLSTKTMKALGIAAATIIAVAITLIIAVAMNTPSRVEVLEDFLGDEVEVISFESGREGLDSFYFARLKCDPQKVRERLSTCSYKKYASNNRTLQSYYLNPPFSWPSDIDVFCHDWVAYTISPGFFRVVAFPSDGRNEILILQFDT